MNKSYVELKDGTRIDCGPTQEFETNVVEGYWSLTMGHIFVEVPVENFKYFYAELDEDDSWDDWR